MSLRINQNVLSIQTHGTLTQTATRLEKSIAKLSSGLRIAHAADDAAGLAISEKMRRQIRGFSRATLNAQDGISMIQVAEGALEETHSNLQRMRELAIQASNDTLTSNDRLEIQKEINQLRDDIDRISRNTEFNTKKLLDGSQTALISSTSASVDGIVTGVGNDFGDFEISMTLLKGGSAQMQRTQIFTIAGTTGELAKGNTQLQSIAQFYDGNGVFALSNPQALTISGNTKTATVNVDGKMTLDKLAGAIANAVQGASGLVINNSEVKVINTASTQVSGLGGYIQVTSGMIGQNGRLSFASDQALLSSLGFSVTREAVDNLVQLKSIDGNGFIRTVETSDGRAVGLLNGIDVKFSSQTAQIAGSRGLEQGIYISTDNTFTISSVGGLATSEGSYIISAGYYTMDGLARNINNQIQVSAVTTGHTGLSASVVDGQLRLSYDPTIVSNSNTFQLNGMSATLGITDGAKSGFATGQKDASKVFWGLTQYQTTADTITYSVGDSVNQVDLVMYSASNVVSSGDMLTFNQLQATVNEQFSLGSVSARLDQIGSTISFTSTRVGTEISPAGARIDSFIQLNISAPADAATARLKFDIDPTTATGQGEKNYRLHVVNNQPQFHIGADEGQVMKVSMGNMSSEALGVDNINLTSIEGASKALGKISRAIDLVSSERSKMGAFQNRLEHTINNLQTMHSNITAAESRIRDADMASEMIEFTRNQIMSQSGTAMLAQANAIPQGVLQLLK